MATTYKDTSPYSQTTQIDFLIHYLDVLDLRNIKADDTDEAYTVESRYHQRPDLLSYDRYDTPDLWWVFCVRNKEVLIDPIYDFTSGTEIYVPEKETLFRTLGV